MSAAALVAGGLLAGGIVLVAFALYLSASRPAAAAADDPEADGGAGPGFDTGTLIENIIDQLTAPLARQGRATRTNEALTRANLDLRAQEWYLIRLLVPIVVFLLLVLFQAPLGVAFLLAVGVFFLPGMLLRARRNQRRTHAVRQLPEALQVMSNALETGAAVPQAIRAVAESIPAPMGEEFGRIDRELQLGVSLDDALDRLAERVDSRDMAMVVSAIEINRQMGGTLASVLETISVTIRERVRLKDRIRVLTAQVRISTRLITLLPFGVAAVLLLVAPQYMAPMFTTVIGYLALIVATILVAVGYFVMSRIVDIQI